MNRDRNDTNCFIWLSYLLEMANNNEDIFKYLASIPSPCYLYSNYVDWIFPFVGEFLRKKEKMSYYLNYGMAQIFSEKMKENLCLFETRYSNFVKLMHPEMFTPENLQSNIIQVVNCYDIYEGPSTNFDDFSSTFKNKKTLIGINPTPLIGNTASNFDFI